MYLVRRKNLMLFLAGRMFSLIGSGVRLIAVPLYILDVTGSGMLMGAFSVLSMVPALLTAPLAGVLGDRLSRKAIMVLADAVSGCIVTLLAIAAFSGVLSLPLIFAAQMLLSVNDSMFNSSADGIMPDLVPRDDLSRANATKGGTDILAMVFGPVFGGMIYGLLGIRVVFMLNAVTYVLSGLCEALISYKWSPHPREKLSLRAIFNEVREVFDFILGHKGLKQLFTFAMGTSFLLMPIFFVIMPYAFKKVIGFSSAQYGYLQAFFMTGILLGNVMIGSFFFRTHARKLMKTGLVTETIFFMAITLVLFPAVTRLFGGPGWAYFGLLGTLIAIMGMFYATITVPVQTNLQKMVSGEIRSRFFSVFSILTQLVVPVGSAVYGLLLDRVQVHFILLVISFMVLYIAVQFLSTATREVYEPQIIALGRKDRLQPE